MSLRLMPRDEVQYGHKRPMLRGKVNAGALNPTRDAAASKCRNAWLHGCVQPLILKSIHFTLTLLSNNATKKPTSTSQGSLEKQLGARLMRPQPIGKQSSGPEGFT